MRVLAICLAAILWGLDGVVLTPRLGTLPTAFVVFLLHATPFVLMQPFLYTRYPRLLAMRPSEWYTLLVIGVLPSVIGTLALIKALFLVNFDGLSIIVLLQQLQPVFAIILAAIILGERITPRFIAWAAAALAGAYALTFGLRAPHLDAGIVAALLSLIAAASFGAGTVLGKRMTMTLDSTTLTFARFGVAAVVAAILVPFLGGFAFADVSVQQWLIVLLIAVTTGSGAMFLYYYGLSAVRATTSTIAELCLPLSAVIFDYLINDATLSPWQWLGAVLLVAAIVRITWARRAAS